MILLGTDINVYIGSTPVAQAKACMIELLADLIEVAPSTISGMRGYMLKKLSWKMSTSMLVGTLTDLARLVGQTLTLSFGVADHESMRVSGRAICNSVAVDGTRGTTAQCTAAFTGTGTISRSLYDLFWGTVNSEFVTTVNGEKIRIVTE